MTKALGTINRNAVFSRVYRSKTSFVSPHVITYVLRRKRGPVRIGITASKKIGCAVVRNRARRVVRAAAAELLRGCEGSYDIVFVCRKSTAAQKSTAIRFILQKHLSQAGVLS